jgi:methionyl aminopeptidase
VKVQERYMWDRGGLIKLKDQPFLERQRVAGKVAAGALSLLEKAVQDKTSLSLLDLDNLAAEYIKDHKCSATFLGYHGFPNSVCISVNRQLVHGIPANYYLQKGDVVSFDLGATFEGAIGDTALTCIYGEAKKEHIKLIKTTKECLSAAINLIDKAVKNSEEIRVGSIGECIYKKARDEGFAVYTQYGGHGLEDETPHALPFVANRAIKEEGIRLRAGMTIAIEPLLIPVIYSTDTTVSEDGWTVIGKDICAHEEHTIFIHEDRVEVITARESAE